MGGFTLGEVGSLEAGALWRRGGLPRSFLAEREADSVSWRGQFIQTMMERDLPQ